MGGNNNFKGRILLIQPFTAKAFCPDSAKESNLSEALHFDSWKDYEHWLKHEDVEPKMSLKQKELFEPVIRMR